MACRIWPQVWRKNADIEILIDTNAVPESPDNTNAGTDNDSNEESKQQ